MKTLSSNDYPSEPVVLGNLSAQFMKQSKFVPLSVDEKTLQIAMADPEDFWTIDALKQGVGLDVEVVAGNEDDIFEAVERLYGAGTQSMEMIIEEAGNLGFHIKGVMKTRVRGQKGNQEFFIYWTWNKKDSAVLDVQAMVKEAVWDEKNK